MRIIVSMLLFVSIFAISINSEATTYYRRNQSKTHRYTYIKPKPVVFKLVDYRNNEIIIQNIKFLYTNEYTVRNSFSKSGVMNTSFSQKSTTSTSFSKPTYTRKAYSTYMECENTGTGAKIKAYVKDIISYEKSGSGFKITFTAGGTILFRRTTKQYEISGEKIVAGQKIPFHIQLMAIKKFYRMDTSNKKATSSEVNSSNNTKNTASVSTKDKIYLKNNDKVSGDLSLEKITIIAPYATIKFQLHSIAEINYDTSTITMKNGDKMRGQILPVSIDIKLSNNQTIKINKNRISKIVLMHRKEK